MANSDVHPDSGAPFIPVPRCSDPCVRVHDLAMLEFSGPQSEVAEAFFTSFGLQCAGGDDGALLFSAAAGAPVTVIYRRRARAEFIGPVFHVRDPSELVQLAERTGASAPTTLDLPGQPQGVTLRDPNGLLVRVAHFVEWRELTDSDAAPALNRGADRTRINSPLRPPRIPSRVLRLGHMVFGTPLWEATARFYIDTLGLIPSDVQALPDGRPAVAFLRCDRGETPADHHTFVVARLPVADFEHAAFEVPGLDDVGMGGAVLTEAGFRRAWGIGRHILGSQIFDYWFGPDGRKFEHFADGDLFVQGRPTGYHAMSAAGLSQWGPPVPAVFLRPRLNWHEFVKLLRTFTSRSGFGFRELRLLATALRSKSLPE